MLVDALIVSKVQNNSGPLQLAHHLRESGVEIAYCIRFHNISVRNNRRFSYQEE